MANANGNTLVYISRSEEVWRTPKGTRFSISLPPERPRSRAERKLDRWERRHFKRRYTAGADDTRDSW
jgi:hypothetical protein